MGAGQEGHGSDQIGASSGLRKTLQGRGLVITIAGNVNRLKEKDDPR
jgi:hypothetical protein